MSVEMLSKSSENLKYYKKYKSNYFMGLHFEKQINFHSRHGSVMAFETTFTIL